MGKKAKELSTKQILEDKSLKYMRIGFGSFKEKTFGHNYVIEIWPPHISSGLHAHGKTLGAVHMI